MTKNRFFTTDDRDGVTILRFHHRERLAGTDLSVIGELWSFLDSQERHPAKVLLIHAPSHLMTPQTMDAFWRPLIDAREEVSLSDLRPAVPAVQLGLEREEHALHRFIRQIRRIPTFVVGVLQGEIDFPFLGPALACDYRIVAEGTVFVNRVMDLSLPPMGAAPWFLSQFLGLGKATEVLLRSGSISAGEAYDLGLVNEVVPRNDLEERTQQFARNLASKPTAVLAALKCTTVASGRTLNDYLDEELRVFGRSIKNDERLSTG